MKKRLLSMAMALVMGLSLMPSQALAADSTDTASVEAVALNETNFPDPSLRNELSLAYDTDGNDVLEPEELSRATELKLDGTPLPDVLKVTSLQGLDYLYNLRKLKVHSMRINTIDFQNCKSLEELDLEENGTTSLILPNADTLTKLSIVHEPIAQLDLSHCTHLTKLDLMDCQLKGSAHEQLSLRNMTELKELKLNGNGFTSLDVSTLENLVSLSLYNNPITDLLLGYKPLMDELNIAATSLTRVDISGAPNLYFYFDLNELKGADPTAPLEVFISPDGADTSNWSVMSPDDSFFLDFNSSDFTGGHLDFNGYHFNGDSDEINLTVWNYVKEENFSRAVILKKEPAAHVSFKVENGTWTNGSTVPIEFPLTMVGGCAELKPEYIPTGMIPDKGYQTGFWDVTPVTGPSSVTGDVTYTYIFVRNPFTDVKDGDWFFDPVMWAVGKGITSGLTQTEFGSFAKCNRAQIVTFLWSAAGKPDPKTAENPFTDVKEGDFFYKPVLWAVENGITGGLTPTTFGPTAACNRAQAVTFLWKFMKQPEASAELKFTDVQKGAWYEKPVQWAVENGVTSGLSDTEFGTTADCLRSQIVTFMYKALVK